MSLSNKAIKKQLIKLRSFVHTHKWIKNQYGNERTGFCLYGASIQSSTYPINNALRSSIQSLYPERVPNPSTKLGTIVTFNDHPDTTKADVRRVINHAIESLPKD